jgi:hypothetical protein
VELEWSDGGVLLTEKLEVLEENLSHCHFVYYLKSLCLNTDIRRGKSTNNCLTYDMAHGEREREERKTIRKTYENAAMNHQNQAWMICSAWTIHFCFSVNKRCVSVQLNVILKFQSPFLTAQ